MHRHHSLRPSLIVPAALALSAGALAGCTQAPVDTAFVSEAPAAAVVGEPVNCITVSRIRATRVHDDRTVDFEVTGGETYRNTMPRNCPRLGFERAISYDVRGGQLCSTDIVYPIASYGDRLERGPGCSLGEFVPVEYVDTAD